MKKIAILLLVFMLALVSVGCNTTTNTKQDNTNENETNTSDANTSDANTSETNTSDANTSEEESVEEEETEVLNIKEPSDANNPQVTLDLENGGKIVIELLPEIAPNTVKNYIKLVEEGYYDGLIFHRVIPGFMIQGGCPEGTGRGNPGYSIDAEFSQTDGKMTKYLSHSRGVLSMARSQDPNSAGSQFFIMHADSTFLDLQYTSFGQVLSGMEHVDAIVDQETDGGDKPLEDVIIKTATVVLNGFDPSKEVTSDEKEEESNKPQVTIEFESGKKVIIELVPEIAPNTVNNFISLIEKEFYNGLSFHRVIPGRLILGGSPDATDLGGPGYTIKDELNQKIALYNYTLSHNRGVVSMFKTQEADSAGSQFFILQSDSNSFDNVYASFAYVVEGLDVLDEIAVLEVDNNDKPVESVIMKSVTVDLNGYEFNEPEVIK